MMWCSSKWLLGAGRPAMAAGGVLIAILTAAGCDKAGDPVPVPTPIAKPTTTDTATGTLAVLGSNYFQFQVAQAGEVYITLKALTTVPVTADPTADPPVVGVPATPVTTAITLVVGQPSLSVLGVSCNPLKSTVTAPGASPQLTGQALAGTFCIGIGDPNGALPASVNYTVTVDHS